MQLLCITRGSAVKLRIDCAERGFGDGGMAMICKALIDMRQPRMMLDLLFFKLRLTDASMQHVRLTHAHGHARARARARACTHTHSARERRTGVGGKVRGSDTRADTQTTGSTADRHGTHKNTHGTNTSHTYSSSPWSDCKGH